MIGMISTMTIGSTRTAYESLSLFAQSSLILAFVRSILISREKLPTLHHIHIIICLGFLLNLDLE